MMDSTYENAGRGIIRRCTEADTQDLFEIINDAAVAYRGNIPSDCWHEPYMGLEELRSEIEDGVIFYGYEENGMLLGVMGLQDRGDLFLIRHAYVRTAMRRKGIGERLLCYLENLTDRPVLMGTWKDAHWAIHFYEKHGYRLVTQKEKDRLLRKYWSISDRQVDTSVVLADARWFRL